MTNHELHCFVKESNRIEGIHREPTMEELEATHALLQRSVVRVADLEQLVAVYAPGARLRREPGMNVCVGDHLPPRGGPHVELELRAILERMEDSDDPYEIHCQFETLHPFLDGNGRSGRALWAWHMQHLGLRFEKIGFLHAWYYQSLSHAGGRR